MQKKLGFGQKILIFIIVVKIKYYFQNILVNVIYKCLEWSTTFSYYHIKIRLKKTQSPLMGIKCKFNGAYKDMKNL